MAGAPTGEVAGVALAAGAGTRLAPLTRLRPKPLCPVGDEPLVDHAIGRLRAVTADVAVNAHHGRAQLEEHLDGRVHVSVEEREALGTAGALGNLRGWLDGRAVLVVNADTWCPTPPTALLDGWDGLRTRVLVAGPAEVSPRMRVAGALMPWEEVRGLSAEPSGLWEVSWGPAAAEGRVEAVALPEGAGFVDCGTPAAYLAANMAASGGRPVVGAGAVVEGRLERAVVWPGARVHPAEHLVEAIRADRGVTVLVR